MRKKIAAVVVTSLLFAGTVSASSINGEFNGNQIVKVKANGKTLAAEDTPAVIYEGRTMVPIYMLKQLGVEVSWDQTSYSVDVQLPKQEAKSNLKDVAKSLKKYGVEYVSEFTDGATSIVTFDLKDSAKNLLDNTTSYSAVLNASLNFDDDDMQITDPFNNTITITISDYKAFLAGTMSNDEFGKHYRVSGPLFTQQSSSSQSTSTNSSTTTQTPSATPTSTGSNQTPSSQTTNNVCKNLQDDYTLAKFQFEQTHDKFNGKYQYDLQIFERDWDRKLSAAGCK